MNTESITHPLRPVRVVSEVEWNDPFLVIAGDKWVLRLGCPWTARVGDTHFTWDDEPIEEAVRPVVGMELLRFVERPQAAEFIFTDAQFFLDIDTEYDPWVLHLPSLIWTGTTVWPPPPSPPFAYPPPKTLGRNRDCKLRSIRRKADFPNLARTIDPKENPQ